MLSNNIKIGSEPFHAIAPFTNQSVKFSNKMVNTILWDKPAFQNPLNPIFLLTHTITNSEVRKSKAITPTFCSPNSTVPQILTSVILYSLSNELYQT